MLEKKMTVNPQRIPFARYGHTMEPFWAHNEVSVTPLFPVWSTYRPQMAPFGPFWPNMATSGLHLAP